MLECVHLNKLKSNDDGARILWEKNRIICHSFEDGTFLCPEFCKTGVSSYA